LDSLGIGALLLELFFRLMASDDTSSAETGHREDVAQDDQGRCVPVSFDSFPLPPVPNMMERL
jgi:hypothetical protein